jgi:beta-phosphoglucomutase-like phosphatase (HAD superfamily)
VSAVVVDDAALMPAEAVFAEAVRHLARKLGAVRPLDPAALPTDRAAAIVALDDWAGADAANWRTELQRFYEAHAPVSLAPDPELNAALRRARRQGARLAVASPLPRASAELALAHVGARRSAEVVCAEEDGDPVAAARAALGAPDAPYVVDRAALLEALARLTPAAP